jgi:hypothetical protein
MDLRIVGFGGRPVRGGVGIKPVLVLDQTARCRFAVVPEGVAPESARVSWWSEEEVVEFEARAQATRIRGVEPYAVVVALYAHVEYVAPHRGPEQMPERQLSSDGLRLETACECYVAFLPRAEALTQLDQWSSQLLTDAEAHLAAAEQSPRLRGLAALGEAMRARYATAGRTDGLARASRKRAFELAWAALLLQGADPGALRIDAALDFSQAEVAAIALEAQRRYSEAPPPPPRSRLWDSRSWLTPRLLEDAP